METLLILLYISLGINTLALMYKTDNINSSEAPIAQLAIIAMFPIIFIIILLEWLFKRRT